MTAFDRTLDLIRKVHAEIGTAEFARLSGVPYTTLRECEARNFTGPSVETLQKLAKAAEDRAAKIGAPDPAEAAA